MKGGKKTMLVETDSKPADVIFTLAVMSFKVQERAAAHKLRQHTSTLYLSGHS